ncbi:MAG: galactosyldiacylglycerol synthase [Acidobacteriota bacterium]|nr:galactosyldiacylglycerol synthase [Acidobacteriota bacterium]
MTIKLYDNDSGAELGSLTEEQLQFLIDQLEEETPEDQDYYLNPMTVDLLAERGGDEGLIERLRRAMGGNEGLEVRWERSA